MLATQSCLTLCDPVDCSPSGPSVLEILQARILKRVAFSFSGKRTKSVFIVSLSRQSCLHYLPDIVPDCENRVMKKTLHLPFICKYCCCC